MTAPDGELAVHTHAILIALLECNIDRLWIRRMHGNREAEAAREPAFSEIDPVLARVVTAIYTAMVLLIDHIRVGRMHRHLMHTLSELRELGSHKISAYIFVIWSPGRATIVGAIAARGRDRDIDPIEIRGIQQNGMQGQAASTRIPLSALWMIVKTFIQRPRFAAIAGNKKAGGLRARHKVRWARSRDRA